MPQQQKPPPVVSGNVSLTFVRTFDQNSGFSSPWGISFGVDGTLYVCDRDNSRIVRLDRDGNVISMIEGFGSRVERIYSPIDVCSSGGIALYAIDAANSHILRMDRNLKNVFVMYTRDSVDNRLFGTFSGLAFDKTSGDLFVTDRETGALIRIDMLGGAIRTTGAFGTGKETLSEPAGLDVAEDGTILIADRGGKSVAVLSHFGGEIHHIGLETLESPVDVAALPDGAVAVADRRGVLVLSGTGAPEGMAGYGVDRDMAPRSVAFRDGELYISDASSASILVYRVDMIKK